MQKEAFDQRDVTILIVDDEPRIRDFVRMNLELEHYRVIEASNGLEALDQLRENLPDLIVLYVMMPEKVVLRPTEYRLLYHLVSNAGRLLTHETLLSKVWGREYRDEAHYLRLYITYLRQKIEQDPAHPKYILTERGVGYRFREIEG